MQPLLASHRINPQLSSKPSAQAGISLIPAVITIFIFTLLTTQVIIPNQFREQREADIEAITNSAEAVVQAAMAFNNDRSRNDYDRKAWPKNTNNKEDLISKYLPFLINNENWRLEPPSGTDKGMKISVNIPSKDIRKAVVRKLGATAQNDDVKKQVIIAVASSNHISIDHLTVNRLTVTGNATVEGVTDARASVNIAGKLTASDAVIIKKDLTMGVSANDEYGSILANKYEQRSSSSSTNIKCIDPSQ